MFDEPESETPSERASGAETQAREKGEELRVHAEMAAVFEGVRKFDAQLVPGFDPELARQIQRGMGTLEKAKTPESPVLPETAVPEATRLLALPQSAQISTNDYHIHRRPGETMIFRWLDGPQVEIFYQRLQAHFDAALDGVKEDERQENAWKKKQEADAYLAALDKIEIKMADRYLRQFIQSHYICVLSTQSADELNINYLADYVMGAPVRELVGASAPPDEPSDQDLAWFYKLFSLRGWVEGSERMCFFAYLQKSDDSF